MSKTNRRGYIQTGPQYIPKYLAKHIEDYAKENGLDKVSVFIEAAEMHYKKHGKCQKDFS